MNTSKLPEGTKVTLTINNREFYATRGPKHLDSNIGVTFFIENPLSSWFISGTHNTINYYLVNKDIFCKKEEPKTKEQLIKERIKKLWNNSNYVRKHNAMLML